MPRHTESNLQIACVRWFRYQYPDLLIFSVPNGGIRTKRNARTLKLEGAYAGVSDLIIIREDGVHLYVEVKTTNGRQSTSQKKFQKIMDSLSVKYIIVKNFTEFQDTVQKFLCI